MRRTGLDELPQLFNVLKGEMSLVGPRPERPCFVQVLEQQFPHYARRHVAMAGITGLAQVRGYRGCTDIRKRLTADLCYIRKWSLWMDLRILVATARVFLISLMSPIADSASSVPVVEVPKLLSSLTGEGLGDERSL